VQRVSFAYFTSLGSLINDHTCSVLIYSYRQLHKYIKYLNGIVVDQIYLLVYLLDKQILQESKLLSLLERTTGMIQ